MIDPHAPRYKWKQLADALRTEIKAGERRGRLPAEPELAREYEVSRDTVRRAIEQLITEELLERLHGLGTYIVFSEETEERADRDEETRPSEEDV